MTDSSKQNKPARAICRTSGEGGYALEKCTEPCSIVIFGATGDLTARKLMPALFDLHRNGGLPERFSIVGCGRSKLSDEAFRKKMAAALSDAGSDDSDQVRSFLEGVFYRQTVYDDESDVGRLADSLEKIDRQRKTGGNRLFYLALPPKMYAPAARSLGKAGLAREKDRWARLVVEKPFGWDLDSAMSLDRSLHRDFKEHQVYRIDHYLAKETVQNVLMFRFANAIFEPVWNRRYIEAVRVTAVEDLGVGHRAGYYEHSGVVRDMFQNHMMQLLSLTAMEPPPVFDAERVRDEKVKVYRSLRPFAVDALSDHLVLGQYTSGRVDGESVPSYRQEKDVDPESITPTYAKMKIFIDNWRWQRVPFYLESGKRLAEKRTEIVIDFKPVPHSMFRRILGDTIPPNRLRMGIYPEERISLRFQAKTPGAQVDLRSVNMDFHYQMNAEEPLLSAYARVLLDCMLGDQTLFWRQDSVEACWSFLTPILNACEQCGDPGALLHLYPAGSDGPEAAKGL